MAPLVGDLYAVLRSPIYPKRSYLSLADTLLKTVESGKRHIHLYGVLASPTAVTEAHSILYCATLFKRYGFTPHVKLFLARWENLVEIPQQIELSNLLAGLSGMDSEVFFNNSGSEAVETAIR